MVSQGQKCDFHPGPNKGININLVGGQILNVSGNPISVQTKVGTNIDNFHSDEEIMFLDNDVPKNSRANL